MSDEFELKPEAVCVAVHEALALDCSVCGAKPEEMCVEEGEELPPYAVHIGRATGGEMLTVTHTGEYDEDGAGIFRAIDN